MKKLLTILCVCVLVLVYVFTLPTKAEAATNPNDFRYTFYYKEDGYASDYVAITGYAGIGGEITIPDAIYGYPVTEIADRGVFRRLHDHLCYHSRRCHQNWYLCLSGMSQIGTGQSTGHPEDHRTRRVCRLRKLKNH